MTLTILTAALAIANSFAQLHGTPDCVTSWSEQIAPGVWLEGVCGDDDGNALDSCSKLPQACETKPGTGAGLGALCQKCGAVSECQKLSELHYSVALSAGLNADAEWEDAFAACEAR